MSQTLTFGDSCAPITCHAWNKDRTRKYDAKIFCKSPHEPHLGAARAIFLIASSLAFIISCYLQQSQEHITFT